MHYNLFDLASLRSGFCFCRRHRYYVEHDLRGFRRSRPEARDME